MKLLDIVTAPWAIIPEKLMEIQEIYMTHLRGEKINIASVEAILGRPLDNKEKPYTVENGVATIYVEGIIAKRMNAFTKISGGVSSQLVGRDFTAALADEGVNSILLYIDSPGGAVDGTQELAREIYRSRGKKPIIAYTDGMMTSAAYWIGAAADKIYISGDTTQVGSIGVVARHIDVSRYEQNIGFKTTEITAGKYKRIASQYEPLTESGRQTIQDQVDYIYSIFVNDIAEFRGLNSEPVKEGKEETVPWADGRIFLGTQSVDVGLVDGVSTMSDLIQRYGNPHMRTYEKVAQRLKAIREVDKGGIES